MKEDINYVSRLGHRPDGAEALGKLGANPSRAAWSSCCPKGFIGGQQRGLAAPIVYTPTNNTGPVVFKMFGYDYAAQQVQGLRRLRRLQQVHEVI